MSKHRIPYNRPYVTGQELGYIEAAISAGQLSGNGYFTSKCQEWLVKDTGCRKAFLVHSGTAALELGALLLDLKEGDEVIMPSFTFVTTATAVVLRGAVPTFVDIEPDTLNLNPAAVAAAVTERTKVIVPVHYAGIGCDMPALQTIADRNGLSIFEDAAHAVCATFDGRGLGSFGRIGALSFHETKNLTCGEGGALLINDESLVERAEMLVEKGTDRTRFFLGLTDKYTWRDVGSSFLCSEIEAAFLWAQMEHAKSLTEQRLGIWNFYNSALSALETQGFLRRPIVPRGAVHNAHLYYIIVESGEVRDRLLAFLNERGINAVFHYVPLHDSPAGRKFGRHGSALDVTVEMSGRLLRLPLWVGLPERHQQEVVDAIAGFFGNAGKVQGERVADLAGR